MAVRVPCGTRAICDLCVRGEHDCGMWNGDIPGLECLEHQEPKGCHCWCMAHPDNRERVKQELAVFGIPTEVVYP